MFTIRKAILWIILICSSSAAFADASDLVIRNGKLQAPIGDYNKNGLRRWYNLADRCYEFEYCADKDVNQRVRDAKTGARSNASVPVKHHAGTPKKTVFKNLLANAKKGKKMGGGWWGIAAGLVSGYLAEKGYQWLEDQQDFVKSYPDGVDTFCIYPYDHLGTLEKCLAHPNHIVQVLEPPFVVSQIQQLKQNLCVEYSNLRPFTAYPDGYKITHYNVSSFGTSCVAHGSPGGSWNHASVLSGKRPFVLPLTQDEFDRIIQPYADEDPSPYVNASRDTQTAPVPGIDFKDPTVGDGTIAQTDPYTNPITGRPEQTKWSFDTKDGATTVTTTTIPRPDLQPESTEAPVPEPVPEEKPTEGTPTPGGSGNQTPEQEKSDLCKEHPDIMACDKQPEKPDDPELEIPTEEVKLQFAPENVFSTDAQCPASVPFTINIGSYSGTFTISLEPACQLARELRPWLILLAFAVAAMFVAKTVRSEV